MRRAKKPALRGTARRVIVVPQPRESAFEQAIFVLRPDAPHISEAELLAEAAEAAAANLGLQKGGKA